MQYRKCVLVPVVGVEPTRYRYHWILSPARLPIPSHRRGTEDIISPFGENVNIFFNFFYFTWRTGASGGNGDHGEPTILQTSRVYFFDIVDALKITGKHHVGILGKLYLVRL